VRERLRPSLLLLILLAAGLGLTYGGFTVYRDQHTGTAGTAKVTGCTGGSGKYDRAVHCRGIWTVGGDPVFGPGRFATGRVEGADYGDIGKTVDVRIHGSDHATVPKLSTAIMWWVLGGSLSLLSLWGLWAVWRKSGVWRRAAA
jgi:hypothetical protein